MKSNLDIIMNDRTEGLHITALLNIKKNFDTKKLNELKFSNLKASLEKYLLSEGSEDAWIQETLEAIFDKVSTDHFTKGLGVYATTDFIHFLSFPFEVSEGIHTGESFKLYEAEILHETSRDFLVLALSKSKSRLFRGSFDNVTEILTNDFPIEFEDAYEHQKQYYKFSKEKSSIQQDRIDTYFRSIGNVLKEYIISDQPIRLLATSDDFSQFRKVNRGLSLEHFKQGNFDEVSVSEIQGFISAYITDKMERQTSEL